ncbi:MAG: DedA family protein, partial [Candidatus Kapaibacterium sp.]
QSLIEWLQGLSPLGIYAALFITTYIENIFPPSPSDVLMLFIATLIGIGTINIVPAILISTAGSVLGFITAFYLGRRFGRALTNSTKFPFITKKSVEKVDAWFDKYGFGVIIINRFMAGTRAVVSFFAGMSELEIKRTTFFCTISALAWNSIVIWLGSFLGENWQKGEEILRQYGLVVSIIFGCAVLFFVVRWLVMRGREKRREKKLDE